MRAPGVIVGDPETVAAKLRDYVDAGADWVILGPIDSSDPENARLSAKPCCPRLRTLTDHRRGAARITGNAPGTARPG